MDSKLKNEILAEVLSLVQNSNALTEYEKMDKEAFLMSLDGYMASKEKANGSSYTVK